jgi:hypothetical protein
VKAVNFGAITTVLVNGKLILKRNYFHGLLKNGTKQQQTV